MDGIMRIISGSVFVFFVVPSRRTLRGSPLVAVTHVYSMIFSADLRILSVVQDWSVVSDTTKRTAFSAFAR